MKQQKAPKLTTDMDIIISSHQLKSTQKHHRQALQESGGEALVRVMQSHCIKATLSMNNFIASNMLLYEQRRETPRLMVARGEFQDVFAHNAQARTGTLMQSHGSAIPRGDSAMRYSPRKANDNGITNVRHHPELSPQKKYSHAFAQAHHSPLKHPVQPSMPPLRSIRSHSPRKAGTLHTPSPRKASGIHQPALDLVASPHFSRQPLPRPNQSPRERLPTHLLPLHDTTSPRRPSLNALSFISAPHDEATHRPLLPTHGSQQPRSYRTAQGLFTRPDISFAGQGASRRGQPDAALSVIAGAKTAAGLGRGIYG